MFKTSEEPFIIPQSLDGFLSIRHYEFTVRRGEISTLFPLFSEAGMCNAQGRRERRSLDDNYHLVLCNEGIDLSFQGLSHRNSRQLDHL